MSDTLASLAASLAGEGPRRLTGDAARSEASECVEQLIVQLAAARGTTERDARVELMRRLLEEVAEATRGWIEAELRR